MSRDYKNAANRGRTKATGSWLWFISGLGAGLLAAFMVYLQLDRARVADSSEAGPSVSQSPVVAAEPAPPLPEPEPSEPPPPKPRFDFYTILPEMEVKVPDWPAASPSTPQTPELQPGAYVLQVASFQRFEEADKVKARLALNGITADIQRVVINGKDTWYRVRVGPLRDLQTVEAMRGRLQQAGMDYMLLKLKDG
jgi:cell division protein FtsN